MNPHPPTYLIVEKKPVAPCYIASVSPNSGVLRWWLAKDQQTADAASPDQWDPDLFWSPQFSNSSPPRHDPRKP